MIIPDCAEKEEDMTVSFASERWTFYLGFFSVHFFHMVASLFIDNEVRVSFWGCFMDKKVICWDFFG